MRNHDTSLQAQSPVADAGDALAQAEHAVSTLLSHPSATQAKQALASLAQAEHAVVSAQASADEATVGQLLSDCSAVHDTFKKAASQVPPE